jgi:hypothetical protein
LTLRKSFNVNNLILELSKMGLTVSSRQSRDGPKIVTECVRQPA